MVIVTPGYNNIEWYELNVDSMLMQDYKNYRILYIDDASTDGTAFAIDAYLKERGIDSLLVFFNDKKSKNFRKTTKQFRDLVNRESRFFTIVKNVNRCGALQNLYRAIWSTADDEIVATVDGDDWLFHDQVLKDLDNIYSTKEVWYTHGTLMEYPSDIIAWNEPIPDEYIEYDAIREFKCPSHLRTFYSWIFKKIRLEDFLWKGKFFPMAWDMAIMYPIAEMAGFRGAFTEEVNYVYNMVTPINDNKVNADLQNECDRVIRYKEHYQRLL